MGMKLTYGVSTWLWTSPFQTSSIEELFPKIAAMGFDAVEIALEDPALVDAAAVKAGLEKYGLKAVVCGAFGPNRDLTSENKSIQLKCFDYIMACLELC